MLLLEDCEHLAIMFAEDQLQYLIDIVHKDLVETNIKNSNDSKILMLEDILDHLQLALEIAKKE